MAYNHFDYVPSSVSHNRSVFKFEKAIAGGCEIGYLYPVCRPVRMYPGSSLKLNLAAEFRSGALIAPLQDSLQVDFFAFKVPNRIVWEHWKQFVGAVDNVLFDNLSDYEIPNFEYCGFDYDEGLSKPYVASHLLASWFELPMFDYRAHSVDYPKQLRINALPFRGYNFIWNEFFRPEQLVSPILFSKTDNGWSGDNMTYGEALTTTIAGNSVNLIAPSTATLTDIPLPGGVVLPTFRVHKSLWTSCLPKPSLETMNLLGNLEAPVGVIPPNDGTTSSAGYAYVPASESVLKGNFKSLTLHLTGVTGGDGLTPIADLSKAILTVNNYRETIMLQNYYDALNRAGSRYDELIRCLFHVNAPEAIIDIPELIVHKRFTIFRKDVVATTSSNYADGYTQYLGSQGAFIDTVVRDAFFTTSTTEHGFVHMLFTIRPSTIRMSQGVEPVWTELDKFDQYYPQFDGMGDVPRYKKEVWLSSTAGVDSTGVSDLETIFGYQEYGAQDKYQRNSAVGWADVNLLGHVPGLTLTEKLAAQPSLVADNFGFKSYISCLVEEDAFAKCLAITNPMVSPQFIVDIRLSGEIVHPMPVYNIPGMGDLL